MHTLLQEEQEALRRELEWRRSECEEVLRQENKLTARLEETNAVNQVRMCVHTRMHYVTHAHVHHMCKIKNVYFLVLGMCVSLCGTVWMFVAWNMKR
jgi:hypothetical protein